LRNVGAPVPEGFGLCFPIRRAAASLVQQRGRRLPNAELNFTSRRKVTTCHTIRSKPSSRHGPFGWISTSDADGRVNLAPYSFFNAYGGRPFFASHLQTMEDQRARLQRFFAFALTDHESAVGRSLGFTDFGYRDTE